jgi:hypothetical protein
VLQSFAYGFFRSLQFTSINTLVYADVSGGASGDSGCIVSTAQQLSMSFGVAALSVSTARICPPPERGGELARRLAR